MGKLTHGSLFSGYGGIDIAVSEVFGARTAWVSDIDPGPCKVLERRFPGVPNLGDITKIDWADVEPVDILSGGSPCQDLSSAGRRAGMTEGTRSNLWVQMREAIATLRPRLVVWENVAGALSARATSELEREKRARDRACICGGADRRGGEHPYRGDEGEVVRPESVLGDDPSSRGNDVGAAQGIRRDSPGDETSDGEMGRGVDVVCPRPGRKTVPFGNSSVPADKEGSRDRGTPSRSSPGCAAEASERAGQLDGGCTGAVPSNERGGPDSEHEGSAAGECAECGGRIDGSPATSELESVEGRVGDGAGGPALRALGRVLGDLAEIGFDAEWATVRASDVGAPHRRARVFLIAWPAGTSPRALLGGSGGRGGGFVRGEECGDDQRLTLLPTPRVSSGNGVSGRELREGNPKTRLETSVALLPTPRATRGGSATETVELPPTPKAGDADFGLPRTSGRPPERSTHLATRLHYTDFGPYAPAIERWERATGRPAPDPTIPSPRTGKPQLSPLLVEWMMGLPSGWFTSPEIGLTRVQALKLGGNGVVPQQAAFALRALAERASGV